MVAGVPQAQTARFNKKSTPLRIPPVSNMPVLAVSPEQFAADFIVAVVNSEPITNNELNIKLARVEQQLAQQGQPLQARSGLPATMDLTTTHGVPVCITEISMPAETLQMLTEILQLPLQNGTALHGVMLAEDFNRTLSPMSFVGSSSLIAN